MSVSYRVCGLILASDLPIPELVQGDGPPDLTVTFGAVPLALPAPTIRGALYEAQGERCLVTAPGVARYLIESGERIVVQPDPGAAEDAVRLFLLGAALGLALTQRGVLVLHASVAVPPSGGAVVFAGYSGRGKSTVLASLVGAGFRMLGDDLAVLVPEPGGGIRVEPVFPRIKLTTDAARHVGLDPASLMAVRPGVPKFQWPTEHRFATEGQPLRAVYVLEYGAPTAGVSVQAVAGGDRLAAVRPHLYGLQFAEHFGYHLTQFPTFATAVGQVPVRRLSRPVRARLDEVVRLIVDECAL